MRTGNQINNRVVSTFKNLDNNKSSSSRYNEELTIVSLIYNMTFDIFDSTINDNKTVFIDY